MSKQYRETFVVGQVQNGPYRELDRVSVRVLSSGYECFSMVVVMKKETVKCPVRTEPNEYCF